MKTVICLSLFGLLLWPLAGPAGAIEITPSDDGDLLVGTILGSGITVSNVTYNAPGQGEEGAQPASGLFNGGLGALGIDSGIILTSGFAQNALGPNVDDGVTGALNAPGDADLDGLIPGFETFDATILEFDFESAGGNLFFNYVFASDEYNEFVNTDFNDVFGFFLDGENIALIPGTTTPVSINNVNNGNPEGDPTPSNPEFYIDNDLDQTGGPLDIEYDGLTAVFTAQALGLTPGTHHIKLAIADAGDEVLDSAVFIQAMSFSDEEVPPDEDNGGGPIPEPGSLLLVALGLAGLGLARRRQRTR